MKKSAVSVTARAAPTLVRQTEARLVALVSPKFGNGLFPAGRFGAVFRLSPVVGYNLSCCHPHISYHVYSF
jgi:hypothetical protein